MKEATGELNMTVVTIVAIVALMAFFYAIIWPTMKVGLALNSACSAAGQGEYEALQGDNGDTISCSDGVCTYIDADGNQQHKTCGNSKDK